MPVVDVVRGELPTREALRDAAFVVFLGLSHVARQNDSVDVRAPELSEVQKTLFLRIPVVVENANRVGVRGVDLLAPDFPFDEIWIFLRDKVFLDANLGTLGAN